MRSRVRTAAALAVAALAVGVLVAAGLRSSGSAPSEASGRAEGAPVPAPRAAVAERERARRARVEPTQPATESAAAEPRAEDASCESGPAATLEVPDAHDRSMVEMDAAALRAELAPFEALESIRATMRYDTTSLATYGDLRVFAYRLVPEDLDAAITGYVDRRVEELGGVDAPVRTSIESLERRYWPVVVELQRRQARVYERAHVEGAQLRADERLELDRVHAEIGRSVDRLLAARRREFDALTRRMR